VLAAYFCSLRLVARIIRSMKIPAEKNPPPVYSEWYQQGTDLARDGRWGEALVFYERCLEIYPSGVEAWHEKAVTLNRLGRHQEALAAFDRVIELRVKIELAEYGGMNFLGRWFKRPRSPLPPIPDKSNK